MHHFVSIFIVFFLSITLPALAQEPDMAEAAAEPEISLYEMLGLEDGPTLGKMKRIAEIDVPEGFIFTGPEGTETTMKAFGNLTDGSEMGFIAPANYFDEGVDSWFIVFEFAEVGYVKDDEKDALDADAMFQQMKEGEKYSNQARQEAGFGTMHLQRFVVEPNYNETTQNLEWALEFLSQPENHLVVNHNIKILGRKGYMQATLVCSPDKLQDFLPEARDVLTGFGFQEGQTYAEYRKGDKIAEYGLTGLVVGGGLALAAKSGLLQKIFKPLIIGIIALGAGIKKFFTGRRD